MYKALVRITRCDLGLTFDLDFKVIQLGKLVVKVKGPNCIATQLCRLNVCSGRRVHICETIGHLTLAYDLDLKA